MPNYRFTTDDGGRIDHDEPLKFKDDQAAADEAQKALADMAKDQLPDGTALDLSASVEKEDGQKIYEGSLKFRGKNADQIRDEEREKDVRTDEAMGRDTD